MRAVVTGGAGFIGSHIVQALLERGDEVVVLDDFSTGYREFVPAGVRLVEGSIAELDHVAEAVEGAQVVFHQAASRAVLRSVEDPVGTDRVNTLGVLNVLVGARDAGVGRVVLASSSSVYGGVAPLPTPEDAPFSPRSPYAVSKVTGELYARVFAELYGLETVALRYFNVFGPRQRPDSQYAAVIPLFIQALSSGEQPEVHGDGLQSRDFTFIDDVVAANFAAVDAPADAVSGRSFNVARGEQTTLLQLLDLLGAIIGVQPDPRFAAPRAGDVARSCADISAAHATLGWEPQVALTDGLREAVDWFTG